MFLARFVHVLALSALLAIGCAPRAAAPGRVPVETIPVPEPATQYTTAGAYAGSGNAANSPVAEEIDEALGGRGERAARDAALDGTASWLLSRLHRSEAIDSAVIESASRRFGFGGVVISFAGFDTRDPSTWREQLEGLPSNVPITHYGVSVSPSGRSAAVVYGSLEVRFAPIPKTFTPGETVRVAGTVGSRFTSTRVYLTAPDGAVSERPLAGREFELSFPLGAAGKYQLEIMGDGPPGPVVLSNIPLYVGVPEPAITELSGTAVPPAEAEERLLNLLNAARRDAGLAPLRSDKELREVALAHSLDMVENNFVGHVSPSTGSYADRVRRSGALVSLSGENIAAASSPEVAHEALMNSPGHRVNMLRPAFTHVGIGATSSDDGLVVTMVFGRRPDSATVPKDAAALRSALASLRREKNLSPPKDDPIYGNAAQAGAEVLASGGQQSEIVRAVEQALRKEVKRHGSGRPASCILALEVLEPVQLTELPGVLSPALRRIGVGARLREDNKGRRLATVLMLEGVTCQ